MLQFSDSAQAAQAMIYASSFDDFFHVDANSEGLVLQHQDYDCLNIYEDGHKVVGVSFVAMLDLGAGDALDDGIDRL